MRSLSAVLRRGATLAVLAAALGAGCGSGDSGKSEPAQAREAGTAEAGLTMDQYSEIERLYRSALPADRLASRSDPASARRLADMIVRSCRQVDRRDPLLAAVVDGCEQTARGLEAFAAPDCATARQCADQMRGFIALIRELIDTVRRNEPVIERHVSDPACREALLTPEQTAAFEDALPALERFAEAVESQDPEQVEAATADMERASKAIENTPSAKEQLERLRSACRPSV